MTVEEYLADLRRHLKVGPLAKRRIVREIESHISDAIRSTREEAELLALERLGPPQDLAQRFGANRPWRLRFGAIGVVAAGACTAALLAVVFVGNGPSLEARKVARAYCGGRNAKLICIKRAEDKFSSGEWVMEHGRQVIVSTDRVRMSATITGVGGESSGLMSCFGEMAVRISDSGLPPILQCRGGAGEDSTTRR